MTRADIERKFDAIVQFAEIEKFIDTAVKRYSSGMYVRLAFSIAAHLEPDILIIDEVLAVGDAEFQRKCLGTLRDSQIEGRTIIVVSHNLPMISQLCRSALWLDQGKLVQQGGIQEVSTNYVSSKRMNSSAWNPIEHYSSDFRYEQISIIAPSGNTPDSVAASLPFHIELRYNVVVDGLQGRIAIQIRNENDVPILSSANTDGSSVRKKRWQPGSYVERCEIPGHLLMPGTYYLTVSLPTLAGDRIVENVCAFTIAASDSLAGIDGRAGFIAPQLNWSLVE